MSVIAYLITFLKALVRFLSYGIRITIDDCGAQYVTLGSLKNQTLNQTTTPSGDFRYYYIILEYPPCMSKCTFKRFVSAHLNLYNKVVEIGLE